MRFCQCRSFLLCLAVAGLAASSAPAYQILLDIDTDNDPTTINDYTEETSAVVKVILTPTTPDEIVGWCEFGLGGSCLECGVNEQYGTSCDLFRLIGLPWVTAPGFDSYANYMMLLGCPDDPGFHCVLWFEPEGGTITLRQPMFLAEFTAWVATARDGCPQPASNLAAMPAQGQYWNYVQIGGPAVIVDVETGTWGRVKSVYRP